MRIQTLPLAAALCAAHLAMAPAAAQGDYAFDKTSSGVLGANLTLEFGGAAPNKILLAMYSLNAGPTPLSALQPQDPRVLGVGTDEINGWFTVATGASGAGTVQLFVPNSTAFQGTLVHLQTLTVPGQGRIVDEISNKVVAQLGAAGSAETLPFSLATARAVGSVCADRDNDAGGGDFVFAGGGSGTLFSARGLNSSERVAFRSLTMVPGPTLTTARALASSVELADGRTLLVGGVDGTGAVLATCEIYDPAQNAFVPTGNLVRGRAGHAITQLPDGRVLVAGGTSDLTDATAALTNVLSSAEVWNPTTGTWTTTGAIGGRRLGPALATLSNGQVLLSGGVEVGFFFGLPVSAISTTACQFYNPGSGTWSAAPAMNAGRAYHQGQQVQLLDGRLLQNGGAFVPSLLGAANAGSLAEAETFDPTTGVWTSANMSQARALHSATLLPDGRVVVAGGAQGTLQAPVSIASTEVFDPTTDTWSAGPTLNLARAGHFAALTPDGLVLLVGGQGPSGATESAAETLHF